MNHEILIETEVDGEDKLLSRLRDNRVRKGEVYRYDLPKGPQLPQRPVVVGLGPAGLFAGLILAQCGQRPLVLERGLPVEEREKSVEAFWKRRILDPESNVQFGEGGAGAFSDGKLTTGTGDARIRKVLEELVKAGAPAEVLTDAKPHIGTDRLPGVVRRIREEIIALGGEVRFSAKVTGIRSKAGQLTGLEVESRGQRETIECSQAILAVGHSARDVFQLLDSLGLPLQVKPFSVGARIEHPQSLIDTAQYGAFAGHPALGAADYKLSCHLPSGRSAFSFCMCPGGQVVASASEQGGLVVNGMSPFKRDTGLANSALVVSVDPGDFPAGPLGGMEFQRKYEHLAWQVSRDYRAPAQSSRSFVEKTAPDLKVGFRPSYRPGLVPADLRKILPDFVIESLEHGLADFERKLPGFSTRGLMIGVETRTSAPVRILRGEDGQSVNCRGLYPTGEGAGYAGGIMSAAMDGYHQARRLMGRFAVPEE